MQHSQQYGICMVCMVYVWYHCAQTTQITNKTFALGITAHTITLSGLEFDELPPVEQEALLDGLRVMGRVEPTHKSKLIELLKKQVGGNENDVWGIQMCGIAYVWYYCAVLLCGIGCAYVHQ